MKWKRTPRSAFEQGKENGEAAVLVNHDLLS